jgi:hypothetical protein
VPITVSVRCTVDAIRVLEAAVAAFLVEAADAPPRSYLANNGDEIVVAAVELLDVIGTLKARHRGVRA